MLDLRIWLTYDDKAVRRDLPDLVAFMLATELRISEASAIHWDDINLDAGTVRLRGNVIRVKGVGLIIRHNTCPPRRQQVNLLDVAEEPIIAPSALKHDLNEEEILHAYRNPVRI